MLPNSQELDPRVRRTRQLIVDAFMALLSEKGFSSLSVQDITARAQINRATFYAHFADKYTLLDYSMGAAFRHELDIQVLNACQFSLENLRVLIATVCGFLGKLHGHCGSSDAQFQSLVTDRKFKPTTTCKW
jgi:AcrR family transcriptional regulator